MAKSAKPARSLALGILRMLKGWKQGELAGAAGLEENTISEWERGKKAPALATLERLAAAMGHPSARVHQVLALIETARAQDAPEGDDAGPGEGLRQRIDELAAVGAAAAGDVVRSNLRNLLAVAKAKRERLHARDVWARLKPLPPDRRRLCLQQLPRLRRWELCELLCAESVRAAADDATRALELADFALFVAGLTTDEGGRRSRLQGYAWAFVGNARRVGGNLRTAEAAFVQSRKLWSAGEPGERDPLDEWRVLDLEASLRREQRRLPEAMSLLDRALALCASDGAAAARILINKAKTLEEMGNYDQAISTLRQAESLFDGKSEPHLRFALRFNLLENLHQVGRHEEAQPMLAEVQSLTARLGNELSRIRLHWLEARIAAALGRNEEAIAGLQHVRGELSEHKIAYDTALASLEIAALYAADHRTEEVKVLAWQLAPVFQAQDVHREALAAVALFRQAAEEERVTVELARRLVDYLQRARHDPELHFDPDR